MPWVQLKNRSSTASWGVVCAAFLVVSIFASPALAGPYRLKADPDLGFECGESLVSGEIACAWKSIENDDGGNVIIQINFTIWNVATGKVAREEGEELEEGDHEEGGTIQFERKLVAEINGYLANKRFVSAGTKAKITFAKNNLRTTVAGQAVTKPLPALSEAEARKCCRPRTGDSMFFSGTKGLLVFVEYACGQAENERAPCFFAGPDWTEKQQIIMAIGGPSSPSKATTAATSTTPKVGDSVWAQWRPNSWHHGKVDRSCPAGIHVRFDDGDEACVHSSMTADDAPPVAGKLSLGARVLAKWTDGKYYPATIRSVAKKYGVLFDDRAKLAVPLAELRAISTSGSTAGFKPGSVVWAQWKPGGWYHGKVTRSCNAGFHVTFDDGDKECIPTPLMAMDTAATTGFLKPGARVLAKGSNGKFQPGILVKGPKNGRFQILFDHGVRGTVRQSDIRALARPVDRPRATGAQTSMPTLGLAGLPGVGMGMSKAQVQKRLPKATVTKTGLEIGFVGSDDTLDPVVVELTFGAKGLERVTAYCDNGSEWCTDVPVEGWPNLKKVRPRCKGPKESGLKPRVCVWRKNGATYTSVSMLASSEDDPPDVEWTIVASSK